MNEEKKVFVMLYFLQFKMISEIYVILRFLPNQHLWSWANFFMGS